jgi:signal transduction histidine kinase
VRILTVHDETRERHVERLKTDFVARVSHELRTPITPIKGYSRLLLSRGDRIDPHRRTKALQVISDRADHLSRLVDDLLQVSQASNSNRWAITTTMRVADLTGIVEKASAGFPEMAKRIRMSLPEEPVMVQCDPDRALQCLTNLITNAQKYALPSSPVDIWIETRGHEATVHVRDHGPGIPESEREKVFLQFYRREDPFTMRTGGAGLGLHIARDFAMAMGGALTLRAPSDGAGSEFVLHLRSADVPALRSPDSPPPLDGSVPALHEARPSETSPAHARTSAPPDLIGVESPGEGADTPDLDGDLAPELADGGTMEPGAGRRAAM